MSASPTPVKHIVPHSCHLLMLFLDNNKISRPHLSRRQEVCIVHRLRFYVFKNLGNGRCYAVAVIIV